MWQTKTFKTADAMNRWCDRAEGRYQFNILFVENGWAVDFRPLRIVH